MRKVFLSLAVFVIAAGEGGAFADPNLIIDPNMIVWYKFDETAPNNIAHDSSGYGHDGFVDTETEDPNWDPNDGRHGGSLVFDNDTAVILPGALLCDINEGITISVWLKDAYRADGNNWVFDAGVGEEAEHRIQIAVVTQPEGAVLWRAGNESNDVLEWDLWGMDPSTLEEWHWWIFVKDERAGEMRIYLDPIMFQGWWGGDCSVASKTGIDKTLINVRSTGSKIGALTYHDNDFVGKMDDFRIFDRALSPDEICPPGPRLACAWAPDPRSGERDVQPNVVLTWRPGDFTVEHHVFFGTSWEDVNSMVDPCAIKSIGDESYDPGPLEFDTTYYWRVDEVNEPNLWKCDIWRFTTANYIVVDDFEAYDQDSNRIYFTWIDWIGGSWIELGIEPFDPIHGADQSMKYLYDNGDSEGWGSDYYSEIEVDPSRLRCGSDWTDVGVKALTLFFYGDPNNDANDTEQMYVGLGGSYAQVNYPDMNDLLKSEWTEWNILISDFCQVDPCAVTGLFIGFGDRNNDSTPGGDGVVYFDDIRLYPPRCVPDKAKPRADLNGDCVVDYKDLKIMADEWLCGGSCAADLYPDGKTDLKDCAILAAQWLERRLWPAE